MVKLLTDNEISTLIRNNPNGRFELKEIAELTGQSYGKTVQRFNSAIKKLKHNPKVWKRFIESTLLYMTIERQKRESYSKMKKKK